jgi:uncharacterized protein GlcG (DUF336 family)
MKLTLEKASIIVDQALAKAREMKIRPLCVAVLDDGGNLKGVKARRQRQYFAATSRHRQSVGRDRHGRIQPESRRSAERAPVISRRPFGHVGRQGRSGGRRVLIMDGNIIIGAAGASGGTSDEDEACVLAGIQAAKLEYKV